MQHFDHSIVLRRCVKNSSHRFKGFQVFTVELLILQQKLSRFISLSFQFRHLYIFFSWIVVLQAGRYFLYLKLLPTCKLCEEKHLKALRTWYSNFSPAMTVIIFKQWASLVFFVAQPSCLAHLSPTLRPFSSTQQLTLTRSWAMIWSFKTLSLKRCIVARS